MSNNRSLGVKISELSKEDLEKIIEIKTYYAELLKDNEEFRESMLKMYNDNMQRISDCCNLEIKEYVNSIKNKKTHN